MVTITTALSMTEPLIDEPGMTVSILPIAETQTATETAATTDGETVTALPLPLLPNSVPPSGFVTIFVVAAAPTAEPAEPTELKTLAPRGNDDDDDDKKHWWNDYSEPWDPENKKGHHEPTFENSGPPFCFRRFDDDDTKCPNGETPEFSWKCTVLNLPVSVSILSIFLCVCMLNFCVSILKRKRMIALSDGSSVLDWSTGGNFFHPGYFGQPVTWSTGVGYLLWGFLD